MKVSVLFWSWISEAFTCSKHLIDNYSFWRMEAPEAYFAHQTHTQWQCDTNTFTQCTIIISVLLSVVMLGAWNPFFPFYQYIFLCSFFRFVKHKSGGFLYAFSLTNMTCEWVWTKNVLITWMGCLNRIVHERVNGCSRCVMTSGFV